MESEEEFISRLDRDSFYRITALKCAVQRAGQDGGLSGDPVDVFAIAEGYLGWLTGRAESEKPVVERAKKGKKQ